MKFLSILTMLSLAGTAQALELASPTGNELHYGGMFQKLRQITLNYRGGLTGDDNTLEINGDKISWTEKSLNKPAQTQSVPLSEKELSQITRIFDKERFLDICGSFRQANIHDAYLETLTIANLPEPKIENVGSLAPPGYHRIELALMELKARKFPKAGRPVSTPLFAPVFRSLDFSFPTPNAKTGTATKTQLSIRTESKGGTLSLLSAEVQQQKGKKKTITLTPQELDKLVEKINMVPWEEIAGTYSSPDKSTSSTPARLSFTFDVPKGTRSIEVSDFVSESPHTYNELSDFLRAISAR